MSAWPDVLLALLLAFGALRGWRRGLIRELTGAIALGAAIGAAFVYDGRWDAAIAARTNLVPSSAHLLGDLAFAFAVYAILTLVGAVLGRIAKLPLIGTANAALGACVGIVKTALLAWVIVYVALFFPLPRGLRDDLRRSRLIAILTAPDPACDAALQSSLPWFVRPSATALFAQHHL